jgi:hypothetical protein
MDAPPSAEALLVGDALAVVVANAAAMRSVGAAAAAASSAEESTQHAGAATPGAAALLRSLTTSLCAAEEAGDAARGRARLACVCRRTLAAADVTASSPVQRATAHARARACAAIRASLARDGATLCCGAPALARLCAAAAPPINGIDDNESITSPTAVAAAWRQLARHVDAAAPAAEARAAAGVSPEEMRAALAARLAREGLFRASLLPGESLPSRAKQLRLIGATAQEVTAGRALCA